MKPIQFILIPALIVVLLVFIPRLKRSLFLQAILAVGGVILITFVIAPDLSTQVANFVGIGRGVDLILYLGVLGLGVLGLSLHLKLRRIEERQQEIVRQLAIRDEKEPESGIG